MTDVASELQDKLTEAATRLEVPGVAAGILLDGREAYAYQGVTSVEHPLLVDGNTLFQFGSTGKTYTATAVMRLVEQGRLTLDDRVRTHVPELRLKDEGVAEAVTILHLLNHTAGWQGDLLTGTGDGDDALARYVELMADLEQEMPLGSGPSYNNAALCLAGRVIEKVTGSTYEQAIRDLVLEPLGMKLTFFFPSEIMTHRFAAGHQQHEDGTITVVRPWAMARSNNPAGGMSSPAREQIAWARFHLGDGRAPDGPRVLTEETLRLMQRHTASTPLGDGYGLAWHLRDLAGAGIVEHGGDTFGQHSTFSMCPERGFAVTVLTNCGPNGSVLNDELQTWAYEHYLGLTEPDPVLVDLPAERLAEYAGSYDTLAVSIGVRAETPRLAAAITLQPDTVAQLKAEGMDVPEDPPPFQIGLTEDGGDRFVVTTEGPYEGMKGYFTRDESGRVAGLYLGRLATRTADAPA